MSTDTKSLVERRAKVAANLVKIADASRRDDGTDIPLGEQLREAAALLESLAPVEGMGLETNRQEQLWLREMFDAKAPRFTSGEIAKTEEVLQRYHRDFDRLSAQLAAEKAALAEADRLAVHHSFRADEAEARAEKAEAALRDADTELTEWVNGRRPFSEVSVVQANIRTALGGTP